MFLVNMRNHFRDIEVCNSDSQGIITSSESPVVNMKDMHMLPCTYMCKGHTVIEMLCFHLYCSDTKKGFLWRIKLGEVVNFQ